ncbi:Hsp70 family protein [Candidatus Amarolinea dominans]|nr:Hsp70 family protein [Anaerolineae bacterium]
MLRRALVDVTPLTFGIETLRVGSQTALMSAPTIPTKKSQVFFVLHPIC